MRGGWELAQRRIAPAQQLRRHLHRRHRRGRAADAGHEQPDRGLGRHRQRRLDRSVRRQRGRAARSCSATGATAPSRTSRRPPACGAPRSRKAWPPATTTTTDSPTSTCRTSAAATSCIATTATARFTERGQGRGRAGRRPRLSDLVLRLRQRRLGRPVRHQLLPVARGDRTLVSRSSAQCRRR